MMATGFHLKPLPSAWRPPVFPYTGVVAQWTAAEGRQFCYSHFLLYHSPSGSLAKSQLRVTESPLSPNMSHMPFNSSI